MEFIRRRQKAAFSPDLDTGTSISGSLNKGGFGSHGNLASLNKTSEDEDEYVGTDGLTPLPFPCHIMTSTMPRAIQTVGWINQVGEVVPYPIEILSNLNPLDKGDFTGMELEDIAVKSPTWYNQLGECSLFIYTGPTNESLTLRLFMIHSCGSLLHKISRRRSKSFRKYSFLLRVISLSHNCRFNSVMAI